VTVVLADDHPIWRDGVRADLADGFAVVGEASTADEAIVAVRRHHPDLVVCDLQMPGGGGIKVARTCGHETRIVILTVSEQERDLLDAVAAGAVGYLVKSTSGPELRANLRRAAAGEPVFSPALAALVLGEFRRLAKASSGVQPLSQREREVLQLVARGHTYREIGDRLYIAEKTVENHVRNILGKLHLNRKQELIRYALEHGIE
jgi:DNA-binding NarL/FixJ family response regulator